MGAATSTRKLTVDSIALLEMLEPSAAERTHKAQVRCRIEALLKTEWPSCRVLPFGSTETGLGFGGSDLDLGIYFEDVDADCQHHFSPSERCQMLSTVCARLGCEFEIREFVQHARVPIVKLWDRGTRVACDICVGSFHVLLNTALLKSYGQMDPRVRPIAFAIKHWAKQRGINDSANGTLSSYGIMLLLIYYLQSPQAQHVLPPVSPMFRFILAETSLTTFLMRLSALHLHERGATFGTSTQESVGSLLIGFFRFYASEFNYEDSVVSIRMGHAISKTTKWSRSVPWRLSIEDPFELTHDVGRVLFSVKGQEWINREFQRAHELLWEGHRLQTVCVVDSTAWNWCATCYICGRGDHSARQCAQVVFRLSGTTSEQESTAATAHRDPVGDCWYCGGAGHVKSTCPLHVFLDIPNPTALGSDAVNAKNLQHPGRPEETNIEKMNPRSRAHGAFAHGEQSLGPIPARKIGYTRHVKSKPHQWASPPLAVTQSSPIRTTSKKKKRLRQSFPSVPPSSPELERSHKYLHAAARLYSSSHTSKCGRHPSKPGRHCAKLVDIPCLS